mgnify:CR=1 FL=1|jgi:ribosomal protein L11 methyltransferase
MSAPDRRWLELTVRSAAGADAASILAEALILVGGQGVLEEDGACVTYFAEPDAPDPFVADILARVSAVTGFDDIQASTRWQNDEDWSATWKRGLGPRRVSARIVVRPSWTPFNATVGDVVIVIDPGMAFGTAEHGTTRGCLRLLDRVIGEGDRVLDVGAGSGILTVAAALLGAAQVVAMEGDPMSREALEENLRQNEVGDRTSVVSGWADADVIRSYGPLHGLMANIETSKLRPMLDGFRDVVSRGGWLIVSGILADEWTAFRMEVEAREFEFVELDADDEWVSGLLRRM